MHRKNRNQDESGEERSAELAERESAGENGAAPAGTGDAINIAFDPAKPATYFPVAKPFPLRFPGDFSNTEITPAEQGSFIISGVRPEHTKKLLGPFLGITSDKIAESGNGGGTLLPGQPATDSPGTKMSMGRVDSGETVASGYDPLGNPSIVQLGIQEVFIASVTPTPGMTDEEVLLALQSSLQQQGISTTFDSIAVTLSLNAPILDGQTAVWAIAIKVWIFGPPFWGSSVAPSQTLGACPSNARSA